ncbi:MAG: c-type cytochrome [Chloroflexi bacterium]|nr:c-type cytochrome [Chloroflexota bacterium]
MNNTRTYLIEALIGLGATLIIVTTLGQYMLNESSRINEAQAKVLSAQLDESMTLYAENCAVCHGLNGEGIGATPALDNPALVTMTFDDLYKTISRGRFDTAMPAWSKEDGGPLSDYQIEEMVALIQYGDWNATGERVVNLGLAPLVPFTTDPNPALFAEVQNLPDGLTLQTAIQIFASSCVACHGADGLGTGIAPALNDPAVRAKTADELTRTITFGNAGTLMAGWSNSLTGEEINAMVTLIQRWDEIPAGIIPAPNVPIPTTAESIALGSDLYTANCSRCHGPDGQGTPRAPSLNVKGLLTTTSDLALQQIITSGVPGTAMPTWGDRMTDAEIQAIVGFIRQWEATAPEVAVPAKGGGGGPPWLRNQTTTTAAQQPAAGTSNSTAGQANNPHQTQQAVTQTTTLDWRILLLAFGALSISFTLIFLGVASLRRKPPKMDKA